MTAASAFSASQVSSLADLRSASRWRDPRSSLLLKVLGIGLDDPRFARYKQALWQGDPLADEVAAWIHANKGGWQLFQQALEQGVDSLASVPAPFRAFFDHIERRPHWVDDDLMRRGAHAVLRSGLIGTTALGSVSLMIGYAADAAVKPLAMTGNLSGGAKKRLSETSRWTIDCALSETLPRDSEGFRSTVRVRMMHAFIRGSLAQRPDWRADDWGAPIQQLDMMATQLEFSTIFMAGCAAQGLVYSHAEREAIMHYYRYICWLMGVDEDLQPRTFREGLEAAAIIMATSDMQPDADSAALTRGLFGASRDIMAEQQGAEWFKAFMGYRAAALSRLMLSDRVADRMEVPPARSRLPLLAGSALIFAADRLLGLAPATRAWRDRLGRQMFQQALKPENFGFIPTISGRAVVKDSVAVSGSAA